jgi:hypothetical protein
VRHPVAPRGLAVGLVLLLGLPAGASSAVAAPRVTPSSPCGRLAIAPHYRHVVVIVMENHSYGAVVGSPSSPYVDGLAARCGLATNYHNITHYSLPNYLALTSGMSLGALAPFDGDCAPTGCAVPAGTPSVFSQLQGHGGWRGFAESMPVRCDRDGSGEYAPRHNPAVYYRGLAPTCPSYDVPLGPMGTSALLALLAHPSSAPGYLFVAPNLCDDTHDCPVSTGDAWLKGWVGALVASAAYRSDSTAILITWDEGEPSSGGENCAAHLSDQSCHVATLVVAPSVRRGTRSGAYLTHYSLLATAEQLLGVGRLGAAKSATTMVRSFNL